ncbi:hypothetical protein OG885_43995 [Streptomyces sp. NBC_00028]|uniref:hypothetical protein n=1 Tax=Streptomyces sp. NBC_00028 TaxID=2975624 RepID=UPI00324B045C
MPRLPAAVEHVERVLDAEDPSRRSSSGLRERNVCPLSILALFRANSRSVGGI